MRRISLTIEDLTVQATLLDDSAPHTAERWWQQLPITGRLRHFRWGGEAGYLMVPEMKHPSSGLENPVSFYPQGSVCVRPEHGEVVIAYGQSQARSHLVPAAYATHFAQIAEGRHDAFLALVRETGSAGGKTIVIERREA